MNILFLTLLDFNTIDEKNIYTDVLREFEKHGHDLFVISPTKSNKTHINTKETKSKTTLLKIKTGSIQKIGLLRKGFSTLTIGCRFIRGIKKYFSNVRFDLVIYSTPPITFCNTIEFIKKRDGAKTYLLLKDIFPQNAVDIGMISKKGVTKFIYYYFRDKEKKLYELSDRIGCMSNANVEYILKNNVEILKSKIEVCPNSIELIEFVYNNNERIMIKEKYGIPKNKIIFVYGGNLGKPQGINYLLKCLDIQKNNNEIFFLIIGNGTEYKIIESYIESSKQKNVKLISELNKEEYDKVIYACDVGMIFLDYRFTVPNFPSRILSYMQAKIPVFAITDEATDIGKIIYDGEFGWWCKSNNIEAFSLIIDEISKSKELKSKGNNGFEYLKNNYLSSKTYSIIMRSYNELLACKK